jgi:phytoene dehydrogenase-like protein
VSTLNRRDLLRALAASLTLPVQQLGAASRRRSVGIVGGGMAGVSLAWLLDGARDVVLLEARDSVGGNVQTVEIDVDGHRVLVDMGAQYFHPRAYPVYTALLRHLGLHVDDLVFASSGPATARLLARLPGTAPQLVALSAIDFEPQGSRSTRCRASTESGSRAVTCRRTTLRKVRCFPRCGSRSVSTSRRCAA